MGLRRIFRGCTSSLSLPKKERRQAGIAHEWEELVAREAPCKAWWTCPSCKSVAKECAAHAVERLLQLEFKDRSDHLACPLCSTAPEIFARELEGLPERSQALVDYRLRVHA